jgi:hypothetical protein
MCLMLHSVRPGLLALVFSASALLSCPGLRAQENCNVEVKLLLSASETQAVVAALGARNETKGRVYFFDTDALELLRQGAIVRLRRNASSDLTVKFRPRDDKKFLSSAAGLAGFKCEIDLTGDGQNASYSITSPFAAQHLPQAGFEIPRLLNAAQLTLFPDAQASVDWNRVKRLSKILSTDWQIPSQPPLGKLVLELWEWPGGKVLELSTKVPLNAAASTYAEMQRLVQAKHLSISPEQHVKTTIALQSITHTTVH